MCVCSCTRRVHYAVKHGTREAADGTLRELLGQARSSPWDKSVAGDSDRSSPRPLRASIQPSVVTVGFASFGKSTVQGSPFSSRQLAPSTPTPVPPLVPLSQHLMRLQTSTDVSEAVTGLDPFSTGSDPYFLFP